MFRLIVSGQRIRVSRRSPHFSVDGASGGGVLSGVATLSNGVSEGASDAIVDVPEVAEVDAVVVDAVRLGAAVASDHAARVVLGEVEHLVISVLTVLGQTLAPNVVIV